MTKIKICGLKSDEDIKIINSLLPDYAGFILSKGFSRTVEFERFKALSAMTVSGIKKTGVFVNEPVDSVLKFAPYLDALQLHGEETAQYAEELKRRTRLLIIKAVRAKSPQDIKAYENFPCDYLLIDAYSKGRYGGTGKTADADIIKKSGISRPFFIAGGIHSGNAEEIINALHPYGVDSSSMLETDNAKDYKKAKAFIDTVRQLN